MSELVLEGQGIPTTSGNWSREKSRRKNSRQRHRGRKIQNIAMPVVWCVLKGWGDGMGEREDA